MMQLINILLALAISVYSASFPFSLFFSFFDHTTARRILVSWPRIEPRPHASSAVVSVES